MKNPYLVTLTDEQFDTLRSAMRIAKTSGIDFQLFCAFEALLSQMANQIARQKMDAEKRAISRRKGEVIR